MAGRIVPYIYSLLKHCAEKTMQDLAIRQRRRSNIYHEDNIVAAFTLTYSSKVA
ncbi:MAG: hypothetical protein HY547_04100 [Elusimicrobia bacterium]|nr:hypothetical protein [Elusimicrobiota bacterium]